MTNLTIALIGDPNSGKTTLFNALTGSNQRIGNWPGVTVEKKEGQLVIGEHAVSVIDLPGTYTLSSCHLDGLDERIAIDYIHGMKEGFLINVVDASNLERHLYLTLQLLELNLPMVIVLTMNDRLPKNTLDINRLEALLGVPIIPVQAHKDHSLAPLLEAIITPQKSHPHPCIPYPDKTDNEDYDVLVADARYGFARELCLKVINLKSNAQKIKTSKIDTFVLNRLLGIPVFLFVMYLLFLFSINIGGIFQDFFDNASNTLFVDGMAYLLTQLYCPDFLIAVLAYGLGKGINTVLTFVPVIASMFFFLSFLEGTGYMARAAFVIDRLMRSIGLPGKAFVPLIIGFGCNVPSVMATRTLDNEKDRIMTSIMSPFMLCSARLAIFTVFVNIFYPNGSHNIIFSLYLIGILMAVMTGFFLKSTLLGNALSPLIMELPPYNLPSLKGLIRQTWSRLSSFLIRAGRVIIPVCAFLGALNTLSFNGHALTLDGQGMSVLSLIGKAMTPIFHPMGITSDNWPATVGLLMGTLAKEVVIGTLNTLYESAPALKQISTEGFSLWDGLYQALLTIPEKIKELTEAFYNPVLAAISDQNLNKGISQVLRSQFGTSAAAYSYLVFVLLYVPCISTMAAIKKELNNFWMYFSLIWSTAIAYMSAVLCFQFLTFSLHPLQSFSFFLFFLLFFCIMKKIVKNKATFFLKPTVTVTSP